MKIAVSAAEQGPNAQVDPRFGRAHTFMLYDSEADDWQTLENSPNLNALQGAGIQTAQMLAKSGVEAVLTGHCGPKAFRVLNAAGIKVYTDLSGTVSEALAAYRNGGLSPPVARMLKGTGNNAVAKWRRKGVNNAKRRWNRTSRWTRKRPDGGATCYGRPWRRMPLPGVRT